MFHIARRASQKRRLEPDPIEVRLAENRLQWQTDGPVKSTRVSKKGQIGWDGALPSAGSFRDSISYALSKKKRGDCEWAPLCSIRSLLHVLKNDDSLPLTTGT